MARPFSLLPMPLSSNLRAKQSALAILLSLSLLTVLAAGPAKATTVSRLPLTVGRTLSGVVGGGGEPTADAFAAYRGRANEVVTSYTSTDSWDLITGVTKQGLTQI